MIVDVTLRLYPSDYTGLTNFLFKYRLELNKIPLSELEINQIVLANFFTRYILKNALSSGARWKSRQATKQYLYSLPSEVAVALFEILPAQITSHAEQGFLAALTQSLVNADFITLSHTFRPKPQQLLV